MKLKAQHDGVVLETREGAFIIRQGVLQPILRGTQIVANDVIVIAEHGYALILLENGAVLDYDREIALSGAMVASYENSADFMPMDTYPGDDLKTKTVIHMLEGGQDISGKDYDKITTIAVLANDGFNHLNLQRINDSQTPTDTMPEAGFTEQVNQTLPPPDPMSMMPMMPGITPVTTISTALGTATDPAIVVSSININPTVVNEGDSLVFHVALSRASTQWLRFSFSLGAGSAVLGSDFSSTQQLSNGVLMESSGDAVMVPPGVTDFSVTVYTLNDAAWEPGANENLWLQVGDLRAEGAIVDMNVQPGVLSIEPGVSGSADDSVNEGQPLVFHVTLNSTLAAPASLDFSLGGGTAGAGDYTSPIFSNGVTLSADGLHVNLPAGINGFTVTVPTLHDGIYEPGSNETLPIEIGGVSGVGGIVDIDTPPVVSAIEAGAAGTSGDAVLEGQTLVFNVTLSNMATTPTTLAYSLGNGNATSGQDYAVPPSFSNGVNLSSDGNSIIVPAGVSSFSVSLVTLDDGVTEPGANETLELSIGSVTAVGQIIDINGPPRVASIEPGSTGSTDDAVTEGQNLVFNVSLSHSSAGVTNLAWSLGGGTASNGSDYAVPPVFSNGVSLSMDGLSLNVPAGVSSFTVTVATIDDGLYEPGSNETVQLSIDSVTAVGQIIDATSAPTVVSIEPGAPGPGGDTVNEGDSLVFNVTLSNPSTAPALLAYTLGGGTATPAVDFAVSPTFSNGVTLSADGLTLIVPAGVTGFSVNVPTLADGVYEAGAAETVPLIIGGVAATGAIVDVDAAPVVNGIEPGAAGSSDDTVNEGQSLVFTVSLSNASATATSLAYSLGGGSATAGADFAVPPVFSNGVTISADGQHLIVPAGVTSFTVSVPTLADGLYEPGAAETLPLTIGNVTANGAILDGNVSPSVSSVEAGVAGSSDDAVSEGNILVFQVTLSNASITPTNLAYALGGDATAGIDYRLPPLFSNGVTLNADGVSLDIPANVTSFSVSIATLNDGIYEPRPDEVVSLSVGGVSGSGAIIDINNPPAITAIEPGAAGPGGDAVNEGANLVFNVSLSNPASVPTSYAWSLGGGTATLGLDYSVTPSFSHGVALSADGLTVIVPAGVTSFSVTVPTVNDGLYEPGASETVLLSIGGLSASGAIIDINTAPVVTGIEPGSTGSADDAVDEGQNLVFTVTLSNPSSSATTLLYSLGGGSATSGADFIAPPILSNGVTVSADGQHVIVPAGVTSFTVTVPTLVDGLYEPGAAEMVPLTVGSVTINGAIVDINSAPVVNSVEPGSAGAGDDAVLEGQSLVFTVSLSNASTVAITLDYTLGTGTATAGVDYGVPPSFSNGVTMSADGLHVIVPAGVTSFSVTVPTLNDGIYETGINETLPLTIGGVMGNGQIVDVNTPPTVIAIEPGVAGSADDAVLEGHNLVFTVSLSNASTTATSIAYSLGSGSASAGLDYSTPPAFSNGVTLSANGLTLIVPAGVTSFTVTVATVNDGLYEPGANETVPLTVGNVSVSGAIIDADSMPTVTAIEPGIAGSADDAVNEGQSLVFTVSLSNASNTATTLAYSLGGATAGSAADFSVPPTFSNGVALSGDGLNLIVPAGITSFTITVATLNDNLFEPGANETVPLSVGGVTVAGEIVDVDTVPTVVSIEPGLAGSSDDAVNEGQNLVFNVTLSNASSTATTLSTYLLGGGTATSGLDYTAPPSFTNGVTLNPDGVTLNIPANTASFSVIVATLNDGIYEPHPDESVTLSIAGISASGSIIDVNNPPAIATLEPGAAGSGDDAVNEGQNLVFNVTLSNTSSVATSYAWSLGGGSANSGADYTVPPSFSNGVTLSANGLSVIVPAGVASFSVTVPTLNDNIYEPGTNETVPISIGGFSATGQIIDINSAPTVTSVEPGAPGAGDNAVNEGQNLVYTVSLSNASSTATTLAYSLGGGTASSGADFSVPPSFSNGVTLSGNGLNLIVPAGVTSFTVTVPTLNDSLFEPGANETVPLSVGGVSASGAIIDGDAVPTVISVEPGMAGTSDDAVQEGQNLVFNVTLSNPSASATTLAYSLGGGTATSGSDYTVPPTFSNGVTLNPDGISLTIPANVTSFSITVPTIADGVSEVVDETVPLSVGGVSGTAYISDSDVAPHIVSIEPGAAGSGDDAVSEGQNLVYTVTLSGTASNALSYAYHVGGGTASAGTDYTAPPIFSNGVAISADGLTIIVPAGVASFTATVVTLNDGIYEVGANETVPFSIGSVIATGQIVDVNSAPTVTAVDAGAPGAGDDAVNEGQTLVFNVTLSNASNTATSLVYSLGGGSATTGADFSTPPTFSNGVTLSGDGLHVIVPAGVTSFSISVPVINDGIYEPGANETVPLSVGGISASGQIIDVNSAPTISTVEPGLPGTGDNTVNEGQHLVFNVTLSNSSNAAASFAYLLGGGTATGGIDYTVAPVFSNGVTLSADGLNVIVPANVSSFSVIVATLNDGIYEPGINETLPLSIGGISGTGQIVDINSAPTVTTVEPGAPGAGDNAVSEGQNLVYTVSLSNASSTATTLAYSLGGGTATTGIDFSAPPTFSNGVTLSADQLTIVVPAGVSSFTVTVPTLNDGIYEAGANETVPLSIGGISASGQIIDINSAPTVTSVEPGAPGAGDNAVNEGQNLVYTVSLSNASSTATTLAYSLGGGTAASGEDFSVPPSFSNGVTLSGNGLNLIVPAGVTSFTITVPTLNDNLFEPGANETVPLSVGGVTGTGAIVDTTTAPTVTSIEPAGIGNADDAVVEGLSLTYNVALSNASTSVTTLAYSLGGGTATVGIDFSVPPTFTNGVTISGNGLNLLIPAGVTSFSVTVATVDDSVYEPGLAETLPLSIGGVSASGLIIDNDSAPTIQAIEPVRPAAPAMRSARGKRWCSMSPSAMLLLPAAVMPTPWAVAQPQAVSTTQWQLSSAMVSHSAAMAFASSYRLA